LQKKPRSCLPRVKSLPRQPENRPLLQSDGVELQSTRQAFFRPLSWLPPMPDFDRWLTKVSSAAPVDHVGRQAIGQRLAAVVNFLQRAGDKGHQAESIHQLRIWTRRSAAALRLWGPLVPRHEGKAMKKRLRKLRRVAGRVRDCDVLLARLQNGQDDPLRSVVKALKARRRAARKHLHALHKKLMRHRRLETQAAELIDRLVWPKRHSSRRPPRFGSWCRSQLAPVAKKFFNLADGELSHDANLHELRIAGKRLRYALELAPAAIPAPLVERLYGVLTDLQDRLGTVCDHLSAIARLEKWIARAEGRTARRALRAARQSEMQQLAVRRRQFMRWWTAARRKRILASWNAIQRVK
jgi:CHAD domain-containing protein